MNRANLLLLIFFIVAAIGWGILYWVFFADDVIGG
jgi:hypothetical protein